MVLLKIKVNACILPRLISNYKFWGIIKKYLLLFILQFCIETLILCGSYFGMIHPTTR